MGCEVNLTQLTPGCPVGIGLLSVLMLVSGAALVVGAAWGPRLAWASSLGGLLVGGAALVVGSVLLIGGDRQDAGSGAAKAALGLVLLLVFGIAFWASPTSRKLSGARRPERLAAGFSDPTWEHVVIPEGSPPG